jgi:hypothetical protein
MGTRDSLLRFPSGKGTATVMTPCRSLGAGETGSKSTRLAKIHGSIDQDRESLAKPLHRIQEKSRVGDGFFEIFRLLSDSGSRVLGSGLAHHQERCSEEQHPQEQCGQDLRAGKSGEQSPGTRGTPGRRARKPPHGRFAATSVLDWPGDVARTDLGLPPGIGYSFRR